MVLHFKREDSFSLGKKYCYNSSSFNILPKTNFYFTLTSIIKNKKIHIKVNNS